MLLGQCQILIMLGQSKLWLSAIVVFILFHFVFCGVIQLINIVTDWHLMQIQVSYCVDILHGIFNLVIRLSFYFYYLLFTNLFDLLEIYRK